MTPSPAAPRRATVVSAARTEQTRALIRDSRLAVSGSRRLIATSRALLLDAPPLPTGPQPPP